MSIFDNGSVLIEIDEETGATKETPIKSINEQLKESNIEVVAELPDPETVIRGKVLILDGDGVADDAAYVCIKLIDGSQVWKQTTLV